ncbi:phosphonate ABC transporter, permease protein PhnE [Variovorax boronicumulans]|uniref:phosphonate ABC transporter, permease protein PhnE n=1 Tax=Variovorax boronicumulans TaxID=436515 RepID=UPI001C59F2B4
MMTLPPAPPPCIRCRIVIAGVLAAVVASFVYLGIDYRALFTGESLRLMARFVAEFFPPDLSPAFLAKAGWGALQTLAVSALGTLLAAVAGAVLALPASGRLGRIAQPLSRFILNFLRSVPELVWAALMVLAAGIGPFAGALALGLHTTGVLGRLFAEGLENAPRDPEDALVQAGAGPVSAFIYASLQLVLPQWVAYTLYRWEMNIRMAAVLGFVGGGGLGQLLYFHLSIFQQQQAMTVLIAMFGLVALVDFLSARLRRGLGSAYA